MRTQLFKELEPSEIFGDRRANGRCSIDLPIQFEVVGGPAGQTGTGTVLNLSSTGMAFYTVEPIPSDCFLDVAIAWPCPGATDLTFTAYGRVVRNTGEVVAVHVLRHRLTKADAGVVENNQGVQPKPAALT